MAGTPEMQEHFPAGASMAQSRKSEVPPLSAFHAARRIRSGLQRVSVISHRRKAAAMAGWRPAIKRSPHRSSPTTKDKETVMNYAATAALALALSLAAGATFAADAPAKAVTPQQQRMKDCNAQATGKHGDERKAFMSTCLKGSSTAATAAAVPPPAPKHAASKSKSNPSSGKH